MYRSTAIVCLLATVCWGSPRTSPRILGGDDADIGDFPFTASIEWLNYGHYCGAVIISADWILTDAWCTSEPAFVAEYNVLVGSSISGEGTVHNVLEWVFHPLNDVFISEYDFALVKVTPPFEFSATVAAAALPALDQETPDGVVGVVTGWGEVEGDLGDTHSDLQYANITLVNDTTCASLLGDDYNERTLCAQGENLDVALCWRDEGGPLVAEGTLFGIALWPRSCSDPLNAQKFGRVASVRDWIDATIEV